MDADRGYRKSVEVDVRTCGRLQYMEARGSQWKSVWKLVEVGGSSCGSRWKSMEADIETDIETRGRQWKLAEVHGGYIYIWKLVEIYGGQGKFPEVSESCGSLL